MRIYGIDVNALTREGRTGVERYVFSLITHMMKMPLLEGERVVLYASAPIADLPPLPIGWDLHILPFRFKGWTHLRLSFELWRRTPDVFFSPGHEIPLLTGRTKIVSTLHDVAFAVRPDLYASDQNKRQQWAVRRAKKKADAVVTVSEATKHDLMERFDFSGDAVFVTPLAAAANPPSEPQVTDALLKELNLYGKKYILTISRIEKKKNVLTLVRAFNAVAEKYPDLQLVLAGKPGFGYEDIVKECERGGFSNRIHRLGFVSDQQASALLARAHLFAFPSYYEGFGMPILEAMEAGLPVISSSADALKEVGGEAALYAPAEEVTAWVSAIDELFHADDVRTALIEKGRQRAAQFSWERCAKETWDVLRSV